MWLWTTFILTRRPSGKPFKPLRSSTRPLTNTSFRPSPTATKPKPLSELYHFTEPTSSSSGVSCAEDLSPRTCFGDREAPAALTSTNSVTSGPRFPGPNRTVICDPSGKSSLYPADLSRLTWRKASLPSSTLTKPNPLSESNHLTTAATGSEDRGRVYGRRGSSPEFRHCIARIIIVGVLTTSAITLVSFVAHGYVDKVVVPPDFAGQEQHTLLAADLDTRANAANRLPFPNVPARHSGRGWQRLPPSRDRSRCVLQVQFETDE